MSVLVAPILLALSVPLPITSYPPEAPAASAEVSRSRTAPALASAPDLVPVIRNAVDYLDRQYNEQVGLLRESPTTAPYTYWLATDNLLAWRALTVTDQVTLAAKLDATLASYRYPTHGLIEVLDGQIVTWPPHVATQQLVTTIGPARICLETRLDGLRHDDWAEYADLAFYGVLLAHNRGQQNEARDIYRTGIRMFDGVGFDDKADGPGGVYSTYKLALALLAAHASGEQPDARVETMLLSMQAGADAPIDYRGGFYAHYGGQGRQENDTNTETTSLALLALSQRPRLYLPVLFRGEI